MNRLANLLPDLLLYLPNQQVQRHEFLAELANAQANQWNAARLEHMVQARLQALRHHAVSQVPFYRQFWASVGSDPTTVPFTSLPVLEKDLLRAHYTRLFSEDLPPVTLSYSSGTQGATTVVMHSRRSVRLGLAASKRYFDEARLPRYPTIANLLPWPSPPLRRRNRYDWGAARVEVGMLDYCRAAQSHKPINADAIIGPPLVLRQTADILGPRLGHVTRAVINCYERLDPATRTFVETRTELPIFDVYAASELAAPIAFECIAHQGFHVNDDYVKVEVVDDEGQPVEPGQTGQVLVTDLTNLAMPIIRYRIGDIATMSTDPCPCGRSLSRLTWIEGRASDIIQREGDQEIPAAHVIDRLAAALGTDFRLVQDGVNRFTLVLPCGSNEVAHLQSIIEQALDHVIELHISQEDGALDVRGIKRIRFLSQLPRPLHVPADRPPARYDTDT